MPGAFNVPVTELIENGRLIAPEQIARDVRGRRRRSRQADDHELRLGRHRGDAVVRARRHRQAAEGALRRLLDRMGRPARPAGRDQGLAMARLPNARTGRARHRGRERHRPRHRAASARRRLVRRGARSAEDAARAAVPRLGALGDDHRRRRRRRDRRARCGAHRARALRPARRGGLQRRHHDPPADPPAVARRLAPRHRHQPDRDVPAGARGRSGRLRASKGSIVTIASTRALMSEPNTEVLFRLQGRAARAHPCARDQPRARRAGQLREPGLDRDQRLPTSSSAATTPSIRPGASASRRMWPRSWPSCSTARNPASSPAPISWSTAA